MSTTHAVSQPLRVGDLAPDVSLSWETGEPLQLSDLWSNSERGLVLVFLRTFG